MMKKIISSPWTVFTLAMAVVILTAALAGRPVEPVVEQVEVIKYVEVIEEHRFDTTFIEEVWCGDFSDGHIRMVGAWWYADGVVEDEQGRLWGVEQAISEEDFLLLWIADNYTPNNALDDVVIKVWREAY